MYTCGITPYDSAHLGHIFTFMTYDLLQRRLEDAGHTVKLVRNITDVDEPIFKKAAEVGLPYTELAARETESFQAILRELNFRPAYAEPRASEYIAQMAAAVAELVRGGYAYSLEDDIYFDTARLNSFGSFSGFNHRLKVAFMRARGGDPERPGKRQPLDFLLWRHITSADDPAAWQSPVGRGRPGWHIECSVMAAELLGTPFDLHGGGNDLIFPHHECEIAQTAALGHGRLARHWMHVAPLIFAGEKMSKSLGNLVFVKDLLGSYEPAVIRLALMHYHYRVGGEWQPELLLRSATLLQHARACQDHVSRSESERLLERIRAALDNDLDTHQIIHALKDCTHQSREKRAGPDGRAVFSQSLQLLGLA